LQSHDIALTRRSPQERGRQWAEWGKKKADPWKKNAEEVKAEQQRLAQQVTGLSGR
jgi:hypothetical protein